MRKLIVCNIVSLDGYYTGPDKNVMALPMDEAFDAYNAEQLRSADALLVGRTTYEGLKGFWPSVADDPNFAPARIGGRRAATLREISQLNNAIDKVVVSDSLTPDQTAPWQDSTRIVKRLDAHERIAELKRQTGKDILMFGSHILWNDLLAHGLVDELHLMIGNVVLGGGTPAFAGQVTAPLRLIETRRWEDSSNVLARYEVGRQEA
jgi:dihydrofolate reductase